MAVSAPMQSHPGRSRSPVAIRVPDDQHEHSGLIPGSGYWQWQPETVRRVVQVANPNGLHMRMCSALVTAAGDYQAKVTVQKDDRVEDAGSILGLMSLGVVHGEQLVLEATGPDAVEAIEAFADLFSTHKD